MPPVYNQRPRPLDPLDLDRRTVAELARVLAERLSTVAAVMPSAGCPTCRDAEAKAHLALLRRMLDAIDGRTTP